MGEQDPLERNLVYTNLGYTWTFYGLHVMQFAIAGFLGAISFTVCVVFGLNIGYAIAAFLAACAALVILQWRKPTNYLPDLLMAMVAPTDLTPAADDDVTWEFPIPREALRK
jgi:hypothetical protein